MGQQSTIARLPEDILERLHELLRDPRVTQMEATARINEILEAEGSPERVTKSAVNRYDLKMREVGEKLRQGREVANMWIGKLGAAPQGAMGNLVNELIRALSFDLALKLQDEEINADNMPEMAKILSHMARTAKELEAAGTMNVKREAEIRRQALEAAAKAVGETAKEAGVASDTIARLKLDIKQVYGV